MEEIEAKLEDCGIIPSDDGVEEIEAKLEDSESVIFVDHLPCVSPEKVEQLERIGRKIFSQVGVIKEDGLWMPIDQETKKTLGYCFINYNTAQEAELAKRKVDRFKLDRSHTLAVNLLDDFDTKVPDECPPPEIPGENLQRWLTDGKARDQFVIRAASSFEVLWNDPLQLKPELVYRREPCTKGFVQWSPLGTYLATVDSGGVDIWGGADTFNCLMHYAHPQVYFIDFSPSEKYLAMYSRHENTHTFVFNVIDVRTRVVMIDCSCRWNADDFADAWTRDVLWTGFRWGGGKEDNYFVRIWENEIRVYDTKTFGLIDTKEIKNLQDCSLSPTDPLIAFFVPEIGRINQPARVSLAHIGVKEELRQKNLFNLSNCRMHWQSSGEYLAVEVERYTKTKKSTYTGFELFRIKERDIPIEALELEKKNDKVIAFAWEPKGHRFAVIHGDSLMPDVSFYSMQTAHNTGRVSKLTTLKAKQANALFWSPAGRFILLAGLKSINGQLEFFDVDELQTMQSGEHYMATNAEWAPTGRYVATSVTWVRAMENGFHIWSFNGQLLYRAARDNLFKLSWRPRPPSYLTAEKEKEIAKNLKKYGKRYEAEDQDVSMVLSEQERERRRRLREEWDAWVKKWKRLHEEEKSAAQKLRNGEATDEEEEEEYYDAKDVLVEEVLDVKEEILDE